MKLMMGKKEYKSELDRWIGKEGPDKSTCQG
jgi:hypothetical protein